MDFVLTTIQLKNKDNNALCNILVVEDNKKNPCVIVQLSGDNGEENHLITVADNEGTDWEEMLDRQLYKVYNLWAVEYVEEEDWANNEKYDWLKNWRAEHYQVYYKKPLKK